MTAIPNALLDASSPKPFIITISSRALFDLEESHKIFQEQGEAAFTEYQRKNESVPLRPGAAFGLVKKLLALNHHLPPGAQPIEVILLSRNSPETARRVFYTIEKMELPIIRAVFTSGASTSKYIKALEADLFLSSNPDEVRKAIEKGVGAAMLFPHSPEMSESSQIRIAFDGDAVLFGDESERVCHTEGLQGFSRHEKENANKTLSEGPLHSFLTTLHRLQEMFPDRKSCPIRTALVTARSAPAHQRAINTLEQWGVRVDEAAFLGGRAKGKFLKAFEADLFFDDALKNCESALESGVPAGHVPFGIRNEQGLTGGHGFTGDTVAPAEPTPARPKRGPGLR